jgi:hypothetical protein
LFRCEEPIESGLAVLTYNCICLGSSVGAYVEELRGNDDSNAEFPLILAFLFPITLIANFAAV